MSAPSNRSTEKNLNWLLLLFLLVPGIVFVVYQPDAERNIQILHFAKLSGPIVNPMMGWAPWATIENSNQPHTLVYADLTWRDFEPQEGYYDFDTFEKKQQLARWRQEGKRVVFRFVVDIPGKETHIDIPDWLFEKIHGNGDYYDNEYGKGFSPAYSNPTFIEYHKKVIKALGERYAKDSFFAFIELGSLGHWGEWHTYPDISPLPSEQVKDVYVRHYVDAFPGIQLLMRRPFSIAQKLNLGLYNDMTADLPQTVIWLDWIANGENSLSEGRDGLSAMPNGWQAAPIGGEQNPDLSDTQVYDTNLEQTIQLLQKSHTTFIGPNCPYQIEDGKLQDGLNQILAIMGYRLYLVQARMSQGGIFEKQMHMTLTFSNDGIAPIYYNWPTKLYLLDVKENIVSTYLLQIDLRKVLPGKFYDVAVTLPLNHLKNGTYSIGVAIIDPTTGQPSVKFANENDRQDLIQYIGSFEVERFLNSD